MRYYYGRKVSCGRAVARESQAPTVEKTEIDKVRQTLVGEGVKLVVLKCQTHVALN